jgi:hypothetical protein
MTGRVFPIIKGKGGRGRREGRGEWVDENMRWEEERKERKGRTGRKRKQKQFFLW